MSSQSNASETMLSLPKGGGAVQGIGEKFSPDLHTGTGNFAVPLELPPGRNGFAPQLRLVYSSGYGNGPFGLGWSLSIPGVSRKTSNRVPIYDDAQDVFLLSGAEDLVPVGRRGPIVTRYRPRAEGLFARIEHHRDGRNDYWEVRGGDGLTSHYGSPSSAGNDPAVIADPDDRSKAFAWKLSRTVDSFGNNIEYEYERDLVGEGRRRFDQLYLKRIRYANHDADRQAGFIVSVVFIYDANERPDAFSDHRAGFEIRSRRRCTRIETWTHLGTDRLVRSYDLAYRDQHPDSDSASDGNGLSLLSRITVTGHDGEATQALPPLEFDYSPFAPQRRRFSAVSGPALPPRALTDRNLELIDLFGNGLPDLVEMNGIARYWRNLGNGRFDHPRSMANAPAGFELAAQGVQLLDADGDGRTDLMVVSERTAGYFPLGLGESRDGASFQRYRQAPSFDLEDAEVRLLDLDGDGVTDALRSGSRLECFFNDPQKGWTSTRPVERKSIDVFPNVNFSDPRVKLGDVSGDGLQDIVLIHDGCVEYWPSLGYGNWGPRVTMRNSPAFPAGYDAKRILIGDVDGDGIADLVYVDDAAVTLWINRSGNAWSAPIVFRGTPRMSDLDVVRLVDLNATGVSGLLWSAGSEGQSRTGMYFLDFIGGAKPYLLSGVDNHMGAVTRVRYAPSTVFYLRDETRRETRWQTPLPFPVQVVASSEVSDHFSGGRLVSEFSYHHGYWDGAEREFRGFGRVDQRDTETFAAFQRAEAMTERAFSSMNAATYSPPLETRTWFHQGAIGERAGDWREADYTHEYWPGDPPAFERPEAMAAMLASLPRPARRAALRTLRGSVLRSEVYALDDSDRANRPYSVTETLRGIREENSPDPADGERERIFFPHSLAQRTTQWERGDDPLTQLAFTGDYDAYGCPRLETSIAVPRGRDYRCTATHGASYLASCMETTYAHRDGDRHYLIGKVMRTTAYEVVNDGLPDAFALHAAVAAGTAARQIIGQTLSFYDGPAFVGLPFGEIGDHGLVSRTESLVLTEDILNDYGSNDPSQPTSSVPAYLQPDDAVAWPDAYPAGFRDRLPLLAGYIFRQGGEGSPHARGYFAFGTRNSYDCQDAGPSGVAPRGLLTASLDPLGHRTTFGYDEFRLFPVSVTGPSGLTSRTAYDLRLLIPREVADPNGNRTLLSFTPLGLVASVAFMGKPGEAVGDTPEAPGTRIVYDLLAFEQRRQPVFAHTIRREHHVTATDVPPSRRDDVIETVELSDGFGRLLQTRMQVEDVTFGDDDFGQLDLPAQPAAPDGEVKGRQNSSRVLVSGWQVYDNKGRIVETFEPFFSSGLDYAAPAEAQLGRKMLMFYDPRGQVIRTVSPDGSEHRVVFGVPADLSDPEHFAPSGWEAFTYDANDNAGRTHPDSSENFSSHWNTPASVTMDALGRTIVEVARNGPDPTTDWHFLRSCYDIRGNLLTLTDALGRVAFRHRYDLAGRALREESIDAGMRWTVWDAAGNLVESRDSKGALILNAYDALGRPVRRWASDRLGQPVTLRERIIHGDADDANIGRSEAARLNLLGRVARHYDEAGRLTFAAYDFKGNVLEKSRQVIADTVLLAGFDPPPPNWQVPSFRVDWEPPAAVTLEQHADALLDPASYRTTFAYDGMGRIASLRYAEDVEGRRRELRPHYNRRGLLERVTLDDIAVVERIAYNAKGQRTLIAYGNGILTRFAYDSETSRLRRLYTSRYTQAGLLTYRLVGAALQDLDYAHDLVGNTGLMRDRRPGAGIPNTVLGTDALDRSFTFDPLYRLISATGRECDLPPAEPWGEMLRCTDLTRTRGWTERYEYDAAGNMVRLQHQAAAGGFVRAFVTASGSNRLSRITVGESSHDYGYDANGNLLREATSRHFEWDHGDRLRTYRTQSGDAEPSVHAQYLYDFTGQRVKKLVRKQGGQVSTTVYDTGIFEHHRVTRAGATQENNSIHVMDDKSRICIVRAGAPFPDDTTPAVQFHLADHLGSSSLMVDDTGAFVNHEEFSPYGETTFGSFARKRYRFTGKERDEESGLNYHSARYYAPWQARWISPDPLGPVDGFNLFPYARNNPVQFIDPTGRGSEDEPTNPIIKPDDKTKTTPSIDNNKTNPAIKPETKTTISPTKDPNRKIVTIPDKPVDPDAPTKVDTPAQSKVPLAKPPAPAAKPQAPAVKPTVKAPKTEDMTKIGIPILGEADPDRLFDEAQAYPEKVGREAGTKVAESGTKTAAKGVGKAGAKMLPLVGTLIGMGLAVERAYAADYWGAASEAFGAVPVLGDIKDGAELTGALYDLVFGPPTGPAPKGKALGTGAAVANPRGQIPIPCPGTTQSPKPVPKPADFSKLQNMYAF